jgi:hypothetical protein
MKRSRSFERFGVQNEDYDHLVVLDDQVLKRLKENVEQEMEKRERHLVILGGNYTFASHLRCFCITIALRYADEYDAQFLEEWLHDWFGSIDIPGEYYQYEDVCAFVVPTEAKVLKEIDKMLEVTPKTTIERVKWIDLFPINELEDRLTEMEKENGGKWSGRCGQPLREDILKVLLSSP